jgi:triacylglycerol lipase
MNRFLSYSIYIAVIVLILIFLIIIRAWILSHLSLIGIAGLILIFGSFMRIWVIKPYWPVFLFGVALVAIAAIGFIYIIKSPPGNEIVDNNSSNHPPRPKPSDSALERLRSNWNSNPWLDWPVAETLAMMSEAAYLAPVDAKASYGKMGFNQFETIIDASMVGYIVCHDDVAVIVFRGTDDVYDWFKNLDDRTTETPHGVIHRGFYSSYQPLMLQIIKILDQFKTNQINQNKLKHLWITGHSLGGALALVCAYDLVENETLDLSGVVTFGQPRVACKQLTTHLNQLLLGRYTRYANEDDIVTRVPPPPFEYCGLCVWFTKNSEDGFHCLKMRKMVGATPQASESFFEGEEPPPLSKEEYGIDDSTHADFVAYLDKCIHIAHWLNIRQAEILHGLAVQ